MARKGDVAVKIDRNTIVQLYWDKGMTLREIGKLYGVSHETIRKRMIEFGIEERNPSEKLIYRYSSESEKTAKLISVQTGIDYCSARSIIGLPSVKEIELQKELVKKENERLSKVTLICDSCGQEFVRRQASVINNFRKWNQQRFFCSNHCQGLFTGENYGFKAHPENASCGYMKRLGERKYNYEVIWAWHRLTGYSGGKLSKHLGLSPSCIDNILHRIRHGKCKLESEIKEMKGESNA